MEAQITTRRSIGPFKTVLIVGGIIVAVLVLPFLMRGDFNASLIPHLNFSTKDLFHQSSTASANLIKNIANMLLQ